MHHCPQGFVWELVNRHHSEYHRKHVFPEFPVRFPREASFPKMHVVCWHRYSKVAKGARPLARFWKRRRRFCCNLLTGSIPASIGSLWDLQHLDMSANNLTGCAPSSLGNLSQLQYMDLSNNRLSGTIPNSFNGLTLLSTLCVPAPGRPSGNVVTPECIAGRAQGSVRAPSPRGLASQVPWRQRHGLVREPRVLYSNAGGIGQRVPNSGAERAQLCCVLAASAA